MFQSVYAFLFNGTEIRTGFFLLGWNIYVRIRLHDD